MTARRFSRPNARLLVMAAVCLSATSMAIGPAMASPPPTDKVDSAPLLFKSLTSIESTTCAIATNGGAWCWGDNEFGQLGDGTTTPRRIPTPVAGGGTWVSLTATGGYYHSTTCAIRTDRTAWCWGANDTGQLGVGTTVFKNAPAPVAGGGT